MISFPYTFPSWPQAFTLQARVSGVYYFFVTVSSLLMISSPYTFPFYSQEFTLQARVSGVYYFFVTISFPYDFSSLPGLKNSHHMLDFLPLLFFFFTIPLQIHTTGFSFTGGKLELELTFPSPETPSSE